MTLLLSPGSPLAVTTFCTATAAVAAAAESGAARKSYNVPGGDAAATLRQFAADSGEQIVYLVDNVRGEQTNSIIGEFAAREALERMLAGTRLVASQDPATGALVVGRKRHEVHPEPPPANADRAPPPRRVDPPRTTNMKRKNPTSVLLAWLALLGAPAHGASTGDSGASQSTGTISGRVLNENSGRYLESAQVTVEGTTLLALTNEIGEYQISGVPAGPATISAFHTGLDRQTASVTVKPSQKARQDFSLKQGSGEVTTLQPYIVSSTREYNARAIALNEQRFAPNLKNVVSIDEYGDMEERHIGGFLKFIPGVAVQYSVGVNPSGISIRGFPDGVTQITLDGGDVATATVAGPGRGMDVYLFQNMNNLSKVEVIKTPTPDRPANMLGGAINMISRSAFELKKPRTNYRVGGTWGSKNTSGVPGPFDQRAKRVGPVFDLSHTAPVTDRFGYSLSASHADQLFQVNFASSNWDLVKQYVQGFTLSQSPQRRVSSTAAGTVDYKLGDRSVFSAKVSYADYNAETGQYELIATHQGGSGDATFSESDGNRGRVTLRTRNTPINNRTWHGGLNYRYTGNPWKVRGSAYYSSATSDRGNINDGGLTDITSQNFNIYTRFEGITREGPASITTRDAAGNRMELPDVGVYTLTSASDTRAHGLAVKGGAELEATRELDFSVPASIRSGLYYNGQKRDRKFTTNNYTFLGRDRLANNADNAVGLYDFINERSVPGDFGLTTDRFVSGPKFTEYFRSNPDQFSESTPAALHINRVTNSSEIIEHVTAAYLRGDVRLVNNRLWVVGGVRWERTDDEGNGPLNDPGATYQRDANGNIVRDSAGRPVRKTTDPYELALLQYKERGAYAKRSYDGFYPSLNLTYNLTDNVLLRAAYARTIGRPGFSNIIPGVTISDPDALDPRITVNNTGLKPWQADGYDLAVEWYFANNALLSAGAFQRDTKDFFGGLILPATSELLESYGLDDSYLDYDISTRTNVGDARVTGFEFSYKQALTFLPHWARGIQVFANATLLDLKGSTIADFTGYSERDLSYGISLSRPRYSVRLNWSSNGEVRGNLQNPSATVPPETYNFTPKRTVLDASVEVRLTPRFALYAAVRNLLNAPDIRLKKGPGVPSFAETERYVSPGAFWNFGIKGEF